MKILDIVVYRGRNVYSHSPVMKLVVDIEEHWDTPTKDIPGFNERLLNCFPGLAQDTCGTGYAGGFLERLREGTYLGHVLEHVILNIQNTLGFDVKYGKTRLLTEPSVYYLICQFENEVCALECGKVALFVLNCFLRGEDVNISEFLDYLTHIKNETEFGPSIGAIVAEAKKRSLPVTRIGYGSLVRIGHGRHGRLIEATLSDATSCISADIASNKQLTKLILDDHKIPVPYGKVVYTEVSAAMAAAQLGYPVVVKPFNGNQGKGVHTNLWDQALVIDAFREAARYSAGVIVEKHIPGNDYRVLVVGGEVKAVAHRLPAMVVGDGVHTVRELVEMVNRDPARGAGHEKPLTKIKISEVERCVLQKQGLDEHAIPEAGRTVRLRENGNLSTGGTAIDCTDRIHPDNANIAVNAAAALGIDIAGVDMVAEDISKSILQTGGAVIEVNAAPGIRMHLYPTEGTGRNVAKDIVDFLFPAKHYDFPIVSVTGTNGKTTTARLVSRMLTLSGLTVGMTSTAGTYVGERCVSRGDNSGPRSAKALLACKAIDAAVFETARGGILREGLGYDLADVGIITNIAEDHLGLDGIHTLEELAYVKSLVAEAVKPNGFAVLNAEDAMTRHILKNVRTDVILFFKREENIKIADHAQSINVFAENGIIKIRDRKKIIEVLPADQIPITYGGLLDCNIDNCLAAVAAGYALDLDIEVMREALAGFARNPGRFELFELPDCKILLDYAHNPAGYEQVAKLCEKLDCRRRVGIVGMPGDRTDDCIRAAGRLAAGAFDFVYIKEDSDLRGRRPGEVAGLLQSAMLDTGFDPEKIVLLPDERTALREALRTAEPGDLVVVLYEKMEPLLDIIDETAKSGHDMHQLV